MKKRLKKIKTNKEVENMLNKDLSHYMHSENFKPAYFELKPKNHTVTIRISKELLQALKAKAKKKKIHYQKLMRQAFERII